MSSPERDQSSEKTTQVFRGTVTFVRDVILPRGRPFHTVAFTPAPGADPYYVHVSQRKLLRGIAPGVLIEVELTKENDSWRPTRITPQIEPTIGPKSDHSTEPTTWRRSVRAMPTRECSPFF